MEDSPNNFKDFLKIAAVLGVVILGSAFLGSRRDAARIDNNNSFKQDVQKMYLKAAGSDGILDAREKATLLQKLGFDAASAGLEGELTIREGLHQANVFVGDNYLGGISQEQVKDYNNNR